MARRHHPPESVHPNRWMVSYADLMTLLFAFFVVLYASSSVDNEKFKQMSHVFMGVFEQGASVNIPESVEVFMADFTQSFEPAEVDIAPIKIDVSLFERLNDISQQTLPSSQVNVQSTKQGMQVTVSSDALFGEDQQTISMEGSYFLTQLSKVLIDQPYFLMIEVLTDNQVNQARPWQLGANQGMALQQFIMLEGVSPLHLAAVNYGPFQPVATNDDPEGQALNRRIHFVIHDNLEDLKRLKTMTNGEFSANPNK